MLTMLTVWTVLQAVVAALAALAVWLIIAGIVITRLEERRGHPHRHVGGHRRTTAHRFLL